MIPPTALQADVNYFLMLEADARGESPSMFSALDLQVIAYGLRLVAADVSEDLASLYLKVADAIDGLSDLSDVDHSYLKSLYDLVRN